MSSTNRGPCVFPRGSTGRKVTVEHPFVERFGDHARRVLDAGGCRQVGLVLLAGARGDAVDHGGDPRDVLVDPTPQRVVHGIRKIQDHTSSHGAVVEQIVTRHDGTRLSLGSPPGEQPGDQPTRNEVTTSGSGPSGAATINV